MNTDLHGFFAGNIARGIDVFIRADPCPIIGFKMLCFFFLTSALCSLTSIQIRVYPRRSVSQLCLIIKIVRLHLHRQSVVIHQTFRQTQSFRKLIAKEISQGKHFTLIKVYILKFSIVNYGSPGLG